MLYDGTTIEACRKRSWPKCLELKWPLNMDTLTRTGMWAIDNLSTTVLFFRTHRPPPLDQIETQLAARIGSRRETAYLHQGLTVGDGVGGVSTPDTSSHGFCSCARRGGRKGVCPQMTATSPWSSTMRPRGTSSCASCIPRPITPATFKSFFEPSSSTENSSFFMAMQ